MTAPTHAVLDRELLRTAGEHLGTLAERAHEQWLLLPPGRSDSRARFTWGLYAKLSKLSREVLEVAND